MNYNEARPLIKSGDVLAWSCNGWKTISNIENQIIRMVTRSEYYHTGIAWVVAGRVFIIEAVVPKVRIYQLSKELPFYWIPCGETYWNPTIEEAALSFVGDDYSIWQAILGGIGKLKAGEDSNWECAELVNIILGLGDILEPNEAISTPSTIVESLQKKGYPTYMVMK